MSGVSTLGQQNIRYAATAIGDYRFGAATSAFAVGPKNGRTLLAEFVEEVERRGIAGRQRP
jgi:hypothetical protein